MILFKQYHVPLILNGIKTVTRRNGEKRWNVGATHWAQTGFKPEHRFARLRILGVHRQLLRDMKEEDFLKEGGYTKLEFITTWEKINGLGSWRPWEYVWVVEFEVVQKKDHNGEWIDVI